MASFTAAAFVLLGALILACEMDSVLAGGLGGLGAARPANADAKSVASAVKGSVLSYMNIKRVNQVEYTPISYATQVVAGTNYFIKVRISNKPNGYIHIRVSQSLDGKSNRFMGAETGHTVTDPIAYFDPNFDL